MTPDPIVIVYMLFIAMGPLMVIAGLELIIIAAISYLRELRNK